MENEFPELSRLTLVMITFERQKYAFRNMLYWSNTGVILRVLDGSNDPLKDINLKSLGSNVIYKHDPTLAPEVRINNILSEIDTEYVALIADDEFYVVSAVVSCINELDKDDSLIVCSGCGFGFDPNKDTGEIYTWDFGNKLIGYNEVMYESPIKRLKSHMYNYEPTLIYGISRAEPWKTAIKTIANKKFDFFAAFEIQFEMLLSFAGRGKIKKELMWFRSAENRPLYDNYKYKNIEPKTEIKKWWSDYKNEREEFIEIMSTAYEKMNPINGLNYSEIVVLGCEAYIQFRDLFPINRKTARLRNFLKACLPKLVLSIREKNRRKRAPTFTDALTLISNKGVKVDLNGVQKIENNIYDYYAGKLQ